MQKFKFSIVYEQRNDCKFNQGTDSLTVMAEDADKAIDLAYEHCMNENYGSFEISEVKDEQ